MVRVIEPHPSPECGRCQQLYRIAQQVVKSRLEPDGGPPVPSGFLRLSAGEVGAGCSGAGTAAMLALVDVSLLIKQRLGELDLDQRELAVAVQVTESYISQLLTRKKAPTAGILAVINYLR